MGGALRRILMGLRPAEVDQQPVAEVIAHMPAPARHFDSAGFDKPGDQRLEVFGIHRRGQPGEIHQIAEQHGDLSPLARIRPGRRQGPGQAVASLAELCNRLEHPFARAQRQADFAQISTGQRLENIEADFVLCKARHVFFEPMAAKPVFNLQSDHLPISNEISK